MIERGTHLRSVGELVDVFKQWLDGSDAAKLADTSYGGASWLTVDTPLGTMSINADTRREAIESVVEQSDREVGLQMRVVANRRGRINKVVFDDCSTDGWYAYIDPPLPAPASHRIT